MNRLDVSYNECFLKEVVRIIKEENKSFAGLCNVCVLTTTSRVAENLKELFCDSDTFLPQVIPLGGVDYNFVVGASNYMSICDEYLGVDGCSVISEYQKSAMLYEYIATNYSEAFNINLIEHVIKLIDEVRLSGVEVSASMKDLFCDFPKKVETALNVFFDAYGMFVNYLKSNNCYDKIALRERVVSLFGVRGFKLTKKVYIIGCDKFNKSANLIIESLKDDKNLTVITYGVKDSESNDYKIDCKNISRVIIKSELEQIDIIKAKLADYIARIEVGKKICFVTNNHFTADCIADVLVKNDVLFSSCFGQKIERVKLFRFVKKVLSLTLEQDVVILLSILKDDALRSEVRMSRDLVLEFERILRSEVTVYQDFQSGKSCMQFVDMIKRYSSSVHKDDIYLYISQFLTRIDALFVGGSFDVVLSNILAFITEYCVVDVGIADDNEFIMFINELLKVNIPIFGAKKFSDMLHFLSKDRTYRDKDIGTKANIYILTPTEVRFLDISEMVLCDFNSDNVDATSRSDLFFNERARSIVGLVTESERYESEVLKFTDILASSAKQVCTIIECETLIDGSTSLRPSLQNFIPLNFNSILSLRYIKESKDKLASLGNFKPFLQFALEHKPRTLSATNIELLKNNPYEFAVRKIFKLKKTEDLEKLFSKDLYGIAIHRALHNFVSNYAIYKSLPYEEREREFVKVFYSCSLEEFSSLSYHFFLWEQKIKESFSIINQDLPFESAECLVKTEEGGRLNLHLSNDKMVTITAIADRIDIMENLVKVIDYKSGTNSSFKKTDILSGRSMQMLIEFLILKEGGFDFYFSQNSQIDLVYYFLSNSGDEKRADVFKDILGFLANSDTIKQNICCMLEEYLDNNFKFLYNHKYPHNKHSYFCRRGR